MGAASGELIGIRPLCYVHEGYHLRCSNSILYYCSSIWTSCFKLSTVLIPGMILILSNYGLIAS